MLSMPGQIWSMEPKSPTPVRTRRARRTTAIITPAGRCEQTLRCFSSLSKEDEARACISPASVGLGNSPAFFRPFALKRSSAHLFVASMPSEDTIELWRLTQRQVVSQAQAGGRCAAPLAKQNQVFHKHGR